ncbi:MAG: hypothetical protein OEZ39_05655 [Gammaproteobacteria bacterium]|nr:hypothetical protein [Gammaproteobacteria bacterium]
MEKYEISPYKRNLADIPAIIDHTPESASMKAITLLRLQLTYLLLGAPKEEWEEELKELFDSINIDDPQLGFNRLVEVIVAGEIFGVSNYKAIDRAWELYESALVNESWRHGDIEFAIHQSALALACLSGKIKEMEREWTICSWLSPEFTNNIVTLETMFLAKKIIGKEQLSRKDIDDAIFSLYEAALSGAGQMSGVTACVIFIAKKLGESARDLIYGSLNNMSRDIYPDGEKGDSRIMLSEPEWIYKTSKTSPSTLEIILKINGSGGTITKLAPVFEKVIYKLPLQLNKLLMHEMPLKFVKKAGKWDVLEKLFSSSDSKLVCVIELDEGVDINDQDLERFKSRLDMALFWIKSRCMSFKIHGDICVIKRQAGVR